MIQRQLEAFVLGGKTKDAVGDGGLCGKLNHRKQGQQKGEQR